MKMLGGQSLVICSPDYFSGAQFGWALDKWLGTTFLLLTGLIVGAGSGIYLVWLRFGRE